CTVTISLLPGCVLPVPGLITLDARPLEAFVAFAGAAATSGGAGIVLCICAAIVKVSNQLTMSAGVSELMYRMLHCCIFGTARYPNTFTVFFVSFVAISVFERRAVRAFVSEPRAAGQLRLIFLQQS